MEQLLQLMEKNMILDSRKYCPHCNKEKKALELNFGSITKIVYPICECEEKAYKKQKEEDEKKERLLRLESLFKQSRLGERFKKCTFENFKQIPGTETAYKMATDYNNNFGIYKQNGIGLLFSSIPGTGKTHLCGAITNELLKNMTSVIFVVVPELLQQIRNTYNYNADTETSIMYGLAECDLLILDDIGAEKKTDWTTEKLFTVIDSRYRNHKPIICTTNCNSNELKERIGNRTFSRIMEICKPIKLECNDYRLKSF